MSFLAGKNLSMTRARLIAPAEGSGFAPAQWFQWLSREYVVTEPRLMLVRDVDGTGHDHYWGRAMHHHPSPQPRDAHTACTRALALGTGHGHRCVRTDDRHER